MRSWQSVTIFPFITISLLCRRNANFSGFAVCDNLSLFLCCRLFLRRSYFIQHRTQTRQSSAVQQQNQRLRISKMTRAAVKTNLHASMELAKALARSMAHMLLTHHQQRLMQGNHQRFSSTITTRVM